MNHLVDFWNILLNYVLILLQRSLVAKVQRRQMPDVGMLFLNLTVRRSHMVSDSLNEIARKQHDLKKKLKVTFAGEPGLDMGGLTKEWFLLLIRQIFHSDYGNEIDWRTSCTLIFYEMLSFEHCVEKGNWPITTDLNCVWAFLIICLLSVVTVIM